MHYAELQVTSNFSFLEGASHPEELVTAAKALGYRAIAITDRNSLAGVVRAHEAAKLANVGARHRAHDKQNVWRCAEGSARSRGPFRKGFEVGRTIKVRD